MARAATPVVLILCAACFVTLPARGLAAGPGGIAGLVRADSTHAPLAGAEVVIRRAADSTVVAHTLTADDGRFRIAALPLDRYLLRAGLLGYRPVARDVALTSEAPVVDLGPLTLAVGAIPLGGVSVTTQRPVLTIASDRNIYTTRDMPAAKTGTATDLLRTVPELEVDMDGNVSLRGSSSVTIQFNSRPAPMSGSGLTAYLRTFPADRIERIEVVANPSAKYDPEGAAGIVNIVLKDNVDLGLSGSLSLNAGTQYRGPSARVAYQRGKLTMFGGVSGSLSHSRGTQATQRENLLASPHTFLQVHSKSDYKSGFLGPDASVELALDKHSTVYTSFNAYFNESDSRYDSDYALLDSSQTPTTHYQRNSVGDPDWNSRTFTLGFRNVIKPDKNEWTVELRQNLTGDGGGSHAVEHVFLPAGSPDLRSQSVGANGFRERSAQLDDSHPLGTHGKTEFGYRGSERRSTNSNALSFFEGDSLVVTPRTGSSDYIHREMFQSGYFTAGSTFGKLSLQLGVRGEAAHTTLDVLSRGSHYDNDYRSLFPSANFAYDLGKGRNVRLTYSKRIDRPNAGYLNPDVPALDSLNRWSGNPNLKPKYTHSLSLQGTWIGSRLTVLLSPFYRETVNNWDLFKQVDAQGVSLTTWRNAASVRNYGATLTLSLRQTGRLGGSMTLGGNEERHDASNLQTGALSDAFRWTANGYVMFKVTEPFSVQGSLRYSPAQLLAQGQTASQTNVSLSTTWKLNPKAWLSLWVNDPFDQWRSNSTYRDPAYIQTNTSHFTARSAALNLTWTFGKPPEQKQRHSNEEQQAPTPDAQPR